MSAPLRQLLRDEIRACGPISFARYMNRALYEPGLGYYAAKTTRTGKAGDFITNVTVGSCFGTLLAVRIAEYWRELGAPETFQLVEQGANDGQLMQDILEWLTEHRPACHKAARVHFIEPLSSARSAQAARCPQATWHLDLPGELGGHGVFFCNELLDAFPVQRFRRTCEGWVELCVALADDGEAFCWQEQPAGQDALKMLKNAFEYAPLEGWTTEISPGLQPWLESASRLFARGLWLITDYGLHAREYYSSSRPDGTLRGYRKHQLLAEELLSSPGEIDLTCHVNWTLLKDLAPALGLRVHDFTDQMRFLTALAVPMLKTISNPDPRELRWLRQFQTLTHPAQLGSKFQTLQLTK